MLLLKNNLKLFLAILLLFSSPWIYLLLDLNLGIFAAVISVTLLSVYKNKSNNLILLGIILLLILQFQTASLKSLTSLDNDEQRVQSERINSYPPMSFSVFNKTIWLKPHNWIEKNNYLIGFSRIEKNLFNNLDVNKYFFASFPRNNDSDFAKFYFFTLPFFIFGIYLLVTQKQYLKLSILFILPILFLSIIGSDNSLGPFVLIPFFIVSILESLLRVLKRKINI